MTFQTSFRDAAAPPVAVLGNGKCTCGCDADAYACYTTLGPRGPIAYKKPVAMPFVTVPTTASVAVPEAAEVAPEATAEADAAAAVAAVDAEEAAAEAAADEAWVAVGADYEVGAADAAADGMDAWVAVTAAEAMAEVFASEIRQTRLRGRF